LSEINLMIKFRLFKYTTVPNHQSTSLSSWY